jgi:hypothetical protein
VAEEWKGNPSGLIDDNAVMLDGMFRLIICCLFCFGTAVAQFPAGERFSQHVAVAATGAVPQKPRTPRTLLDGPWDLRDAMAMDVDSSGRLWATSKLGLARRDPNGQWSHWTKSDGLPFDQFTGAIAAVDDGSVWIGTKRGAIHFDGTTWEYRQGRRWLPGDEIRAIALQNHTVLFQTENGPGAIETRRLTLGEKAKRYEEAIDAKHRRTPYEYVLEVQLGAGGTVTQHDSDNDGLWTAMYGAGECFAYAATQEAYFKQRAVKAFGALKFLMDVTQGGTPAALPGFIARTVLPTSGPDPNQQAQYTRAGDQRKRERDSLWKILQPRWGKSADGQWWWKTDTSSDELDGHYFFYGVYYDLVAQTEAEKNEVRQVVRAVTDHLLAHDFNFLDHDGTPTRWGVFSPKFLNRDRDWWEERGLNSLSILTYLKVAHHVTGDAKYHAAFTKLIEEHGYAQNAMYAKADTAIGGGNQSDDEMAFMNYYNLVRYEQDPQRRQMWARSLSDYWRHERAEMNPFFHYVAEATLKNEIFQDNGAPMPLGLRGAALPDALDTLRRYPLDLVNWRHENSHRHDLMWLAPGRAVRRNGKVLPADERYFSHWNHDPYRVDSGGDGRTLACATPFLLGYYLGLYHGFVK